MDHPWGRPKDRYLEDTFACTNADCPALGAPVTLSGVREEDTGAYVYAPDECQECDEPMSPVEPVLARGNLGGLNLKLRCDRCEHWKRMDAENNTFQDEGFCSNKEVKSIVYLRGVGWNFNIDPDAAFDEYHRRFDLITPQDWFCADFEESNALKGLACVSY